jgi:hypothetical protein
MNDGEVASAYLDSIAEELEIAGIVPTPERPQGFGFTLLEYVAKYDCTEDVGRNILAKAVKQKKLVKYRMRKPNESGSSVLVYCRPGEWKE